MHTRPLVISCIFFIVIASCAESQNGPILPEVQRFVCKLGATKISIRKTTFGTGGRWFFIQLHDNETTAEAAATAFLQDQGGTLVSIENAGKRLIHFIQNGKTHRFDPNRMFTTTGIRQNLQLYQNYTTQAAAEISRFRNSLLRLLPDTAVVIAVHNNTDAAYSIMSYKSDKLFIDQAAAVHINDRQDADDFFITTDPVVYQKLAKAAYNSVLQLNATSNDDGSLSFYYGRQNRTYLNVEAQAGHLAQQKQMILFLKEVL